MITIETRRDASNISYSDMIKLTTHIQSLPSPTDDTILVFCSSNNQHQPTCDDRVALVVKCAAEYLVCVSLEYLSTYSSLDIP